MTAPVYILGCLLTAAISCALIAIEGNAFGTRPRLERAAWIACSIFTAASAVAFCAGLHGSGEIIIDGFHTGAFL